jgi:hypothetical protein
MDKHPALLFVKAILRHWWALMSCAAFTLLGIWATYAEKDRLWIVWLSIGFALVCFVVAAYRAWANEHEAWAKEKVTVKRLTEEPNLAIAVHGIPAHLADHDIVFVILPDVSIANQSHGLRVAVTADLWMLRDGGMEGWCSPETKAVEAWEHSQRSYRNKHLTLPINLEPRFADQGYLAFCHQVLRGVGNQPLQNELARNPGKIPKCVSGPKRPVSALPVPASSVVA